jgi:translocator protein
MENPMNNRVSLRMLAAFALLTSLASSLAAYFTSLSVTTWYPLLQKPAWTPAADLFGPAWTVLYILIALAGWKAWQKVGGAAKGLWLAYGLQLVLNAAWSGIFFGLRRPDLALLEILALIVAIAWTAAEFRRHGAGLSFVLFLPYLAWVLYAAALNAAIWRLN